MQVFGSAADGSVVPGMHTPPKRGGDRGNHSDVLTAEKRSPSAWFDDAHAEQRFAKLEGAAKTAKIWQAFQAKCSESTTNINTKE
jgi:hypothetical protein